MDKLSELIKEAKPLYRSRKIRKKLLKTTFSLCIPVFLFTGIFQMYIEGSAVYLAMDNNILQTQLMEDNFGLLGLK